MSPGGCRHILRNLSDELDWRPLHFVDRLPPAQVCSACGLVVRRTGSLACGHFVCGPCYEQQCELGDPVCCPFDGEACPEESVQWREFPAENLLERRVYCWNKDNGCSAVLAASELSRHFRLECSHHVVTCPQCSMKILYNSRRLHLRSCTGRQGPSVTESAEAGNSQQTMELTALKSTLSTVTLQMEQQLGNLKGLLEELKLEGNLQTDQINALSHTINSLKEVQTDHKKALGSTMHDLKETLQRGLYTVASQNRDGIARHEADAGTVGETGRQILQKIDLALRCILRTQSSHQWILKGCGVLKARAMRGEQPECLGDPVYLCHYFLQQGVFFYKDGPYVALHMFVRVKKGEVDEYLQWPFHKKMEVSVVHPKTGEKRSVEGNADCRKGPYEMPTTPRVAEFSFGPCFYLNDLERDGYMKNDQLELCFAVLT